MTLPTSTPYAVGQLWRCRGRHAGENPLLLINRIDEHPQGGQILHATLREVQIQHPGAPGGLLETLPHVPVIAQTLDRSDAALVGSSAPDPAYLPVTANGKPHSMPARLARTASRWPRSCRLWKATWPNARSLRNKVQT